MISYSVKSILVTFVVVFHTVCNGYMLDNIQPKWFSSDSRDPETPADPPSESSQPDRRANPPSESNQPDRRGQLDRRIDPDLRLSLSQEILGLRSQIDTLQNEHDNNIKQFSDSVLASQKEREPLENKIAELQNALKSVEQKNLGIQTSASEAVKNAKAKIDEATAKRDAFKAELYKCIAKNNARWIPTTSIAPSGTDPVSGVMDGVKLPTDPIFPAPAVRSLNPAMRQVSTTAKRLLPDDFSTTPPIPVQGVWSEAALPTRAPLGFPQKPVPGVDVNKLHQRSVDVDIPSHPSGCASEEEMIKQLGDDIKNTAGDLEKLDKHLNLLESQKATLATTVQSLSNEKNQLIADIAKITGSASS